MTHEEFKARYKYDYSADLLGEGREKPRHVASIQTLEPSGQIKHIQYFDKPLIINYSI